MSTTAVTVERRFTTAWPGWQRPPARDGLITILTPDAPHRWADTVLAHEEHRTVVWAATGAPARADMWRIMEMPGVRAVSLAAAFEALPRIALALQVACCLAQTRAGGLIPTRPYLTSPHRPDTGGDLVRIPHLVTVGRTDGTVGDAVVWELMRHATARRWFGAPLPTRAFIEDHLPGLLVLRAAVRAGAFPATPVGQRLAALVHGRPLPLTIQLVYRHPDLFRMLLTDQGQPS